MQSNEIGLYFYECLVEGEKYVVSTLNSIPKFYKDQRNSTHLMKNIK
jgi:hypothetical protein